MSVKKSIKLLSSTNRHFIKSKAWVCWINNLDISLNEWKKENDSVKVQLILKADLKVFIWTKKPTKISSKNPWKVVQTKDKSTLLI